MNTQENSNQKKQEEIVKMFDEIAPSYDLANRVLSFGVDISWRKKGISYVYESTKQELNILDVACGSGDMIGLWQSMAPKFNKTINIRGSDASEGMLKIAKQKYQSVDFTHAKAQNLPYEDNSMDIISISYGIRNVVEVDKALDEFARVLKPNGVLLVLEFTKRQKGGFVASVRDFYLKHILPSVGGLISKNYKAYKYLPNSIDDFFTKEEFENMLKNSGFIMQKYTSFSFGVCSMFVAKVNK